VSKICELIYINSRVFNTGVGKSLSTFQACAASAAVVLQAFIARICCCEVYAQTLSAQRYVGLIQICVWGFQRYTFVGAFGNGAGHSIDKAAAAIGVYCMVSGMVGNHDAVQAVAFSESGSGRKHYAVAERHDGRFHVVEVVVAFRHSLSAFEQ